MSGRPSIVVYVRNALLHTRPFNHILTIMTLLTGYIISQAYGPWENVALAIFSWVILGSGGCLALNTFFDKDANSPVPLGFMNKKPPVNEAHLLYIGALFLVTGLFLSLFVNFTFFTLYSASFLLTIAYSTPPLRFKGRPGPDLLINALGYGVLTFLAGWVIYGSWTPRTYVLSSLAFFIFASGYLSTAIYHISHDAESNTRTLAVVLGIRRSMVISLVLIIITTILIVVSVKIGYLKVLSLLVFVPIAIAVVIMYSWWKNPNRGAKKQMYLMYLTALLGLLSLSMGEILG